MSPRIRPTFDGVRLPDWLNSTERMTPRYPSWKPRIPIRTRGFARSPCALRARP
jgi:hypothetical protein